MPKYGVMKNNATIAFITAPDYQDAHTTLEACGIKYDSIYFYGSSEKPVPNTEMPTTQTLFKFNVYDHNDFKIGVVKATDLQAAYVTARALYRNMNHVGSEKTIVTPQQVFDPTKNGPETIYDFSAHAGETIEVAGAVYDTRQQELKINSISPGLYTQQSGRGKRIKPVQIRCQIETTFATNLCNFSVSVDGDVRYGGYNVTLINAVAECNRYTKLLGGV